MKKIANRLPVIFLIFFVFSVNFEVIDLLAAEQDSFFRIAIFKEDNIPYIGTPQGFTADWIKTHLEEKYNISYLNIDKLKDRSLFNVDNIDLLILPYGEAVPEDVLPAIIGFVKDGGGIFTTAGRPFGCILRKKDKSWEIINSLDAESYKALLGLGLNYYTVYSKDIASIKEASNLFDMQFEMVGPLAYDQYGICVKTSERIYDISPTKGNVFPYRIPARDFITPIILMDKDDNYIGAPLILIKSWNNPYRITERVPNKCCIVGFIGEAHPLNPKYENSAKRLKELLEFLSTKIILRDVRTDFASYRKGEPIRIIARALNYDKNSKEVEVIIFIIEDNKILLKEEKKISIEGEEIKEIAVIFNPEELQKDFYEVKALLKLDGKIIDEEQNGFTVWHRDRLNKGQNLTVKGRYLYKNEKPFYLYGINYYESKMGSLMWVTPNILDIKRDISLMSRFGINFLRVHYHHPKWFRDYLKIIGLPQFSYFSNLVDSPLPDEKSLRILDAFIVLCNKYNIYFQPDLFTLVPEEMGDPRGWIGDPERCKDPEKIRIQKDFVKSLSDRYRNIPNITWDLWNEPFLNKEDIPFLKSWVTEIRDCFRLNGDRHLITLGSDESIELDEELDFICGHGYDVEIPSSNKPFVAQEIWNESDLTPEREKKQAEELKRGFTVCIEQGGAGFVPWQWTRQSCLWDDANDAETWDNELGLCVREDGSLKPAGKVYKDLIKSTVQAGLGSETH